MKRIRYLMVLGSILLGSVSGGEEWRWTRIAWEAAGVYSVVALPDSPHVVYAVIDWGVPPEYQGVHKSRDGGFSWSFLDQSQNPAFCARVSLDPKNSAAVYCGTSTQVWNPYGWPWRSLDAGATWQRTDRNMTRYVVSPWEEGVILGVISYTALYGLFMSTDDGHTWRLICDGGEIGFGSEWARFHGSDSLTIVAPFIEPQTSTYGLGVSRDGGGTRTWETWPIPVAGGQILFDPARPSTLYMHGRYWDHGRVTRSDDGGHTWEPMDEGLPVGGATVELGHTHGHAGELFAARTDGLWLWTKRVGGEGAPLAKAGRVRIEGVSPRPFRERVRVRFACEPSGFVHAAVYSVEGRLVRSLMEDRPVVGSHLLTWDGLTSSGLPAGPGVYVVRVRGSSTSAEALVIRVP